MSDYSLLSRLWLREPDAEMLARAREFDASLQTDTDSVTLAAAYADLFLLNVYPYGTAYTDEWGELNTAESQRVADLFAAHGYQPPELREVGAPDHLGLCLGFVGHLALTPSPSPAGRRALLPLLVGEGWGEGELNQFFKTLLTWVPVCCLAAERDPTAHPFYRALAQVTREWLIADSRWQLAHRQSISAPHYPPSAIRHQPDELRLRDVIRFLLAPARCGLFLSRARLGQMALALGTRLPFGSRFEVCEWLFVSAGQNERTTQLLQQFAQEAAEWASAYRAWSSAYPAWQPVGAQWLARVEAMQTILREMEALSLRPLDLEYANPAVNDELRSL